MAGYTDADGCIRYDKGCPSITVVSLFTGVLRVFLYDFGGSIYPHKKPGSRRECWRWVVTGDKAITCLDELTPFLFEKRPQAELVLRLRLTVPGPHRAALIEQLNAMKKASYDYLPD